MALKFPERGPLNLPALAEEWLKVWDRENTFQQSVDSRPADKPYVFFEGPPSANGKPGIHHVMARAIKDIFCRFQTLKGYRVERKAGWDTHGLPIELGVEKELGITKEDIGTKLTVEEYNDACRKTVMRYTSEWNELTRQMGYWVDMDAPYVTYHTKYMESVWWLLAQLHAKGMLYKGYTIQPYSPMAGTGLSSHELNQPGTYRDVKDTTIVAQFHALDESRSALFAKIGLADDGLPMDFLAWTTTPWTLPSNTALTVGPDIVYAVVKTANRYTETPCYVILAEALVGKQFGDKKAPDHTVVGTLKGRELVGMRYEALLDWAVPMDDAHLAFQVIPGDFVTTEDGTGIVHTAPTFGADDARVAKDAGVPAMLVDDGTGHGVPLVDLQGRFRVGPFAGKHVKAEYDLHAGEDDKPVDVEIAILLKERGQAFKVEKYEHSYPHCWRTDKPILYYPLDSWFIRATAAKERMMALNNTITWKPESTGTGRFGKWLENVNDWNLSRSRFWGIPLPIWRTEDGAEERCVGSIEELQKACDQAVAAGVMSSNPLEAFVPGDMSSANYDQVDLHKHVVDDIVLVASDGRPMRREADLIDVWFDSGSMPYAQWHYPFENREKIEAGGAFPADFIAEGVDQTRGWFYTLHAIATMVFDQVAYKRVVSNGLVLDKNGQKMSKRLGNAVDPFETLSVYGPDATRWYMITNAQPWDNLKFDVEGIGEVQRKFFGTLHNTYNFLALYAGADGYQGGEADVPYASRPEIDRWILSRLQGLIQEVDEAYEALEPTRAGRAIQDFVVDELSNWHVRLSRRRFWKGDMNLDKQSAYQTLTTCLRTVAILASPIAPFYMDRLYRDVTGEDGSVHLASFPVADPGQRDAALEDRMDLARQLSSQVLSLRKREKIRVRQPLRRIMVPVLDDTTAGHLEAISDLVRSEVNVKEVEMLRDDSAFVKKAKADFKALGRTMGPRMKSVAAAIGSLTSAEVSELERQGTLSLDPGDGQGAIELTTEHVTIQTEDIPGWLVSSEGGVTVALDVTMDEGLRDEGLSRELVNRIQNLRKEAGLDITDRICLSVHARDDLRRSLEANLDYIRTETLAQNVEWTMEAAGEHLQLEEGASVWAQVIKSTDEKHT
jgi:isoleucyl-tRNA synthetase